MNAADTQALIAFMEARPFGVISTVGEHARPESAFVGYTSNDRHEVIIGTSGKTRKIKNISQNKAVALVVADMEGEVQYEGDAEAITKASYSDLIDEGRFKPLPGFDKYRQDPTEAYVKITPTWIRFIVHGETNQLTEFTEFA